MQETVLAYLVRFGTQGDYGNVSTGTPELQRGDRIVCRTERGLELAEVLCEADATRDIATGRWLRYADANDEMLWGKLLELSRVAADACQAYLFSHGCNDVLLEVEPLLDCKTLIFHFLGDVSDELSEKVAMLTEVYQSTVSHSDFARSMEQGCGPDCGKPGKSNCRSCGGCSARAVTCC